MKVKDFLEKKFYSGSTDTSVKEVLKMWSKTSVNIYIVEDDNGRIVGVVTLYDVLKKLLPFYLQIDDILSDFAFDEILSTDRLDECMCLTAGQIMSQKVVTIDPEDNFLKAASEMFSFEYDYIPVVNEEQHCVGVVTRDAMETAILKLVSSHIK